MTGEDVKALRTELKCTARELAATLSVAQADVMAWERGDAFPTKALVEKMAELRAKGPGAIVRKAKGADPMKALADPALWTLVRKLIGHKKLLVEVSKLAEAYPDPIADDS